MNKMVKGIGVVLVVVLVLLALLWGGYAYMFHKETKMMAPVSTGKLVSGVYAIKDDIVNVFLLDSGNGLIAVDAGNDLDAVVKEMETIGVDPGKVEVVLLTHADPDHTAAVTAFKNATVYLSAQEEQMINGTTKRFFMFGNKLDTPYSLLKDNQVLTYGDLEIRCIATPGHTPGSMSYLVNDRYLFTGDSMSLKEGRAELFNDTFNMDNETQTISLRKLAGLETVTHIFTAHYGYSDNFRRTMETFK